jgi:fermentation-respiration switch protein FrsA (DUF1100 family)
METRFRFTKNVKRNLVSFRMLAAFLIAVGLIAIAIFAGQRRLIYFPFGDVPPPADAGLPDAEIVTFTTEDGLPLTGWFVRASPTPAATMIVFNGNGGHRALRAPLARALADRNVSTLLFDYRGFGDNPGAPTEAGLIMDARAARDYVAGRSDVDPSRLFYFGESLGAAVAVKLAVEHRPRGLILRSPFSSLTSIGRHHYPILPVGLLLRDRFASVDLIGHVKAPLLMIVGTRDRVVPAEESERLYAAANEPKMRVVIDGADHNDSALLSGSELVSATLSFVERTIAR